MNFSRAILVLFCLLSPARAMSAEPPLAEPPLAEPPLAEPRHALLLLEEGPVLLRFHLTLNGQLLSQRREEFISGLIQRLDRDQDGQLSTQEWQQSPLHRFGKRDFGNEFLKTLNESRAVSRAAVERDLVRFGEIVSYRQNNAPAQSDQRVFELLDADRSGRIDAGEILAARARIVKLDQDRDQCVSFTEFLPSSTPEQERANAPGPGLLSEELPSAFLASLIRDVGDLRLPGELLRLYDRNQDQFLTADEIGGAPQQLAPLDQDGDGRLSRRELRDFQRMPADLELRIELTGTGSSRSPPLQTLTVAAGRQISHPRPDCVLLDLGKTRVHFSFRRLDPLQQALANSRQRFNMLDLDSNGYLDRKEIAGNTAFERIWFDAMDANQDGLLYAEEMQSYVQTICEPATTTCQINLYDLGPGYFQMLDQSGDGRISIRELNGLQQTMEQREKIPGSGIGPEDMGRNYFVEFARGSYQIFGASSRMDLQSLSFIDRDPIGPGWFQALDRNRDGDLTYMPEDPLHPPEFIYSFSIAREMDVDGDGLISWEEAEQYQHREGQGNSPFARQAISVPEQASDHPANDHSPRISP